MADRQQGPGPLTQQTRPVSIGNYDGSPSAAGSSLRHWIHDLHAPNSTQVVGFLTLVVSGAVLIVLTGLTVTAAVTGLVFFAPILLLSSPVWVPAAAVLFVVVTVFLSACGAGVSLLAGATWMYKYFSGRQPVGAERVDYARSRIVDTASQVKDYAKEYSGYLQSRIKDAAPGA